LNVQRAAYTGQREKNAAARTGEAAMSVEALEIPLPDDAHPTDDERAMLEALCRLILAVRADGDPPWRTVARRLEAVGWEVHWRLAWLAEARRGPEREQGFGRTLAEAFSELDQSAMLDELEGCP
jgi:hypothetical protein